MKSIVFDGILGVTAEAPRGFYLSTSPLADERPYKPSNSTLKALKNLAANSEWKILGLATIQPHSTPLFPPIVVDPHPDPSQRTDQSERSQGEDHVKKISPGQQSEFSPYAKSDMSRQDRCRGSIVIFDQERSVSQPVGVDIVATLKSCEEKFAEGEHPKSDE